MGYFDHEHNSMGSLTEFLGNKVTLMQGLVGEKLGMIAQAAIVSTSYSHSEPACACSHGKHTHSKCKSHWKHSSA